MMRVKVMHIKGKKKTRLCGAKGEMEPIGEDEEVPICPKCNAIVIAMGHLGVEV